jgi:hypothetical protein
MPIRIEAGPPSTPQSRLLAEEKRQQIPDELARVRAQAEQWRNGLAGITALFTAAGLFSGQRTVAALAMEARVWAGCAVIASIVTAAIGLYLSMSAAFGIPARRPGAAGMAQAVIGELRLLRRTVRALHGAMVCAFISLALMLAALAVTWYGPTS